MAILLDTNVVFAAAYSKDTNHAAAVKLIRSLRGETQIISAPVLNELFYLSTIRVNYRHAGNVFARTRIGFQIEALTLEDMLRMEQIMKQYESAEFDYTDTAIIAQAERLNITRVATFDHRDFEIFRPAHCEYLELLP
jgi:predicted nucleic acid-binding protein